jgi:hypothetical protein
MTAFAVLYLSHLQKQGMRPPESFSRWHPFPRPQRQGGASPPYQILLRYPPPFLERNQTMKIDAKSNSKSLRKEDVPQPFVAVISEVRVQTFEKTARSPREDKDMLHFADASIKPLGLNVTNKRVLVAAYGDESDNWRGQPVEIYVDPNVTNSRGEIVGGIRLRIPATTGTAAIGAAPAPAPKAAQAPRPMPALQAPRSAAEVARTAAEVAQAIDGLNHAQDQQNLEQWRAWAAGIVGTTQAQRDAMEAAFDRAQERIAIAEAPATRRPPPRG